MSCQASHARTKGVKCHTRGVALMEWIVAMALSVLLTWGSAKVFIHAKMAQDAQEAQRQLRACVLAFEAWAWNAGHYPLDEAHGGLTEPPCPDNNALALWQWASADGEHFTVWRIADRPWGTAGDSACIGWAINQDLALWEVDRSGQVCLP